MVNFITSHQQPIIFDLPWVESHNTMIDGQSQSIKLTQTHSWSLAIPLIYKPPLLTLAHFHHINLDRL